MASPPPETPQQMRILSLGLFRTGTYSLCQALTTLGVSPVYHGLNSLGNNTDWALLSAAADATFPNIPTYRGADRPFSRAEWDSLFGSYSAVTDVASIFGATLVRAYPEAKVILVERDYEKWSKSVNETVINSLWGTVPDFFVGVVEPLLGSVAGPANRKMLLGWAGVRDEKELKARLRGAWERHHKEVREACAGQEGRLLEYRMGDGWEPLCEFLGVEVPRGEDGEVLPFPHANEAKALRRKIVEQQVNMLKKLAVAAVPWAGAAGAAGAAWWLARTQGWF